MTVKNVLYVKRGMVIKKKGRKMDYKIYSFLHFPKEMIFPNLKNETRINYLSYMYVLLNEK